MKTAVVTGNSGQDGTYLTEYLGKLGYQLVGVARGGPLDLSNRSHVAEFLDRVQPTEVYHLAAFHHAAEEKPLDDLELLTRSYEVHTLATANLLEGIRSVSPHTRLFYAASSHVFGTPPTPVQNEMTPLNPHGIYGITKQAGMKLCQYYRAQHHVFAAVGILYNHESPLRRPTFVCKKIVQAAVAIKTHKQDNLVLGDLDAEIDWGYAGDYVAAMHLIVQQPKPDDFVISSGQRHRVRDFVEQAFTRLGLDWKQNVTANPSLLRSATTPSLFGDSSKLRKQTGWTPTTSFSELVKLMVEAELANNASH